MVMNMFNEKLKNLREHQELSQAEVSSRLGMPKSTYSRYETGASEPNFKTLKMLARFFDVSIDYLLENGRGLSDNNEVVDLNEFLLNGRYTINSQFLSSEDRQMINDIIKVIFKRHKK